MMGEFKPLLSALVLPPGLWLLMLALSAWMLWLGWRRSGLFLLILTGLSLWALSTPGVVLPLAQQLLPMPAPLQTAQIRPTPIQPAQTAASAPWQAIVVLGGGIDAEAPEWGAAQPNAATARRVRYGVHLARESGLPMAFSGGVGWSQMGRTVASEAEVAQAHAAQFGARFEWLEDQSRDTQQNAALSQKLLRPAGVQRIVLVTDAWHMPRAVAEFERAGFVVLPAATGFLGLNTAPALLWLPSASALQDGHRVLREWLGLQVMRWR